MTATPPAKTSSASTHQALLGTLKDIWGYDEFRPLQDQAMTAVMQKRDSLVVLPTGGGKSLCFQAPALRRPGMALIISPLISLMRDQVMQLHRSGVEAGCLHSGQPQEEAWEVRQALAEARLKLLYLSPERVALDDLRQLLGPSEVSFIAIDEAHCISMWGHDFRPEYRQFRELREVFPEADMHGYTATATREVSQDIVDQLGLRDPLVLRGSFDRPNIHYTAMPRKRAVDKLIEVVRRHPGQPGIIYCISRKETDRVADQLSQKGFDALPYHAGKDSEERIAAQESFINDRTDIIVATTAFGMGINKPDVRFVVHMGMPKSLENFQQESGRAGRDGLPAESVVLHSYQDVMTWKLVMSEAPPEMQRIANAHLDKMYAWCNATECRRSLLLKHFDERYPADNCRHCDHCSGGFVPVPDSHTVAQKILSCVKRLDEAHNAAYTTDVLRGSKRRAILDAEHDKLSTHGLLHGESREAVEDWIEQLRANEFLAAGEGGALSVTRRGWEILRNRKIAILMDRTSKPAKGPEASGDLTSDQQQEFERLRAVRKELAARDKVPPYMVLGDRSLHEIVKRRPKNLIEFSRIHGVGKRKLNDYAEPFLDALWQRQSRPRFHRSEAEIAAKKPDAYELFDLNVPLEAVARQLGLENREIERHLTSYIRDRGLTDATLWVPTDLAEEIEAELEESPDGRLAPIKKALNHRATYLQLRIVQACLRNRG
ncbi:RecQ family ATP-dependent DNA helicase [bacterium]|nr:RecQ family ATP-dependent DNA helicase [bacterium]